MTGIILNQLYPGGVMKQLADAAGGVVYDQYAAGGCVKQLYDVAGVDTPLDQYAEGGPLHQIELEIEAGQVPLVTRHAQVGVMFVISSGTSRAAFSGDVMLNL